MKGTRLSEAVFSGESRRGQVWLNSIGGSGNSEGPTCSEVGVLKHPLLSIGSGLPLPKIQTPSHSTVYMER